MALDLEKYRKKLLEEQAKLNEDLGPVSELSEPTTDDRQITAADAPIIAEVQDVQNRVIDIKSDRMGKINAALQSIDDGTYGTCIECGKQIDPRRLDAEPMAMTCIECAEKGPDINTPTM